MKLGFLRIPSDDNGAVAILQRRLQHLGQCRQPRPQQEKLAQLRRPPAQPPWPRRLAATESVGCCSRLRRARRRALPRGVTALPGAFDTGAAVLPHREARPAAAERSAALGNQTAALLLAAIGAIGEAASFLRSLNLEMLSFNWPPLPPPSIDERAETKSLPLLPPFLPLLSSSHVPCRHADPRQEHQCVAGGGGGGGGRWQ